MVLSFFVEIASLCYSLLQFFTSSSSPSFIFFRSHYFSSVSALTSLISPHYFPPSFFFSFSPSLPLPLTSPLPLSRLSKVKAMDLNESCEELLNRCPDPPVRGNVRTAEGILMQMQALDKRTAKITPLGMFSFHFSRIIIPFLYRFIFKTTKSMPCFFILSFLLLDFTIFTFLSYLKSK